MKIRINPLTIAMFVAIAFIGNLKLYLIAYSVMAIHEFAHLAAAVFIGLKPQSITFSPFGVNLRLNSKIINSLTDEIILYSAGPLINAIFALLSLAFNMNDFYRLNTVLFVMNILPIAPLDGGMIAVRLLSYRLGRRSAKRLLVTVSEIIGIIMLIFATYGVYIGYINISLFIISVLFIGNILTTKEMYDTDFINALSYKRKNSNKAKVVIINSEHTAAEALRSISPSYSTIAFVIGNDGKISKVLSENEIAVETLDF